MIWAMNVSKVAAHLLVGAAAATFTASAAIAQTTRLVPAYARAVEGNVAIDLNPTLVGNTRYQQLWVSSSIARQTAVLSELAWRRDGAGSAALPRWDFQRLRVELSQPRVTPSTMSPDFIRNLGASRSVVFDGAWSFPSVARSTAFPARSFDIRIRFTRPYTMTTSAGNLLADFQFGRALGTGGGFSSTPPYPVDGVTWRPFGGVARVGPADGAKAAGIRLLVDAGSKSSQLRPGGSYRLSCQGIGPMTVLTWVGFSNVRWGSIVLPLDLAGLGAAGSSVLVSLDASFLPVVARARTVQGLRRYVADFDVRVPQLAALQGRTLFHQSLALSPFLNRAGFVTTEGLGLGIGAALGPPLTQSLVQFPPFPFGLPAVDRDATRNPLSVGGPVTEFVGSFR